MKYSKLSLIIVVFCLLLALAPQAKASPTLQSKITEVKNFGTQNLNAIDVTSNGTVIAGVDGDFYVSNDFGVTWTMTQNNSGTSNFLVRVTSGDNIFAANLSATEADIWKSVDYGQTWTLVIDNSPKVWRMAELWNGTLLMNTYASVAAQGVIWKSDNYGDTWSIFYNFTGFTGFTTHIHCVRVNPLTDEIWVSTGDSAGSPILKWDGVSSWIYIKNATGSTDLYTDILFDSTYVYFLPDTAGGILRMPWDSTTWADTIAVFHTTSDDLPIVGFGYIMMGARFGDGLMVVGTDRETMLATIDGERWLKIFQTTYSGSGAWRIDYISQQMDSNGYWYFINDYTNKVYRAQISFADVQSRWWTNYIDMAGDRTSESITLPVANTTSIFINLTGVNVERFQMSLAGLTKGNHVLNPSFENGTSHWTYTGTAAAYARSTVQKQSGSYSLNVNKTANDAGHFYLTMFKNESINCYGYNEKWMYWVYVRANRTMTSAITIRFGYFNPTTSAFVIITSATGSGSTSWAKVVGYWAGLTNAPQIVGVQIQISKSTSYNAAYYVDAIILERVVKRATNSKIDNGDTMIHKTVTDAAYSTTYYDTTIPTSNVTLTTDMSTENITYVGNLTESARKDYFFTKAAETFTFTLAVNGSAQVLVIITFAPPSSVFGSVDVVFGVAIIAGTTTAIAWVWRRRTKTRAVSVP